MERNPMMRTILYLCFITSSIGSCQVSDLKVIADLPSYMKEVSAVETTTSDSILWVLEDAGNKNVVYGLDLKGKLIKTILVENASNVDWEDLTTDSKGNLYIGDFGNNQLSRRQFSIYGVSSPEKAQLRTKAQIINFTLELGMKSLDFEAFFEYDGHFYIFSKKDKGGSIFSIPNKPGDHIAKEIGTFRLSGKHSKVTSADISPNGKTIVLLTHDQIWTISGKGLLSFSQDQIKGVNLLGHISQKEGVCFKDKQTLYITDERNRSEGGNIYEWTLKR